MLKYSKISVCGRLHCSPQSCKSDSNQTFQCTSNNNVILWSVVELHMTCSHVKSSSVIESVIVETCQELCLPVSIADFLLNIKFLLCGFRDSMISQAITGKTIWDTWKICLNTMLDIPPIYLYWDFMKFWLSPVWNVQLDFFFLVWTRKKSQFEIPS